ncbi:hypothetical protein ABRZ22_09520 [Bacillus pacificus]|uniref:hypothetical protein n=1 Tax=Bacillus pacificus TaxID=2026187 RepID=UPI003EE229FC
MQKIRSPASQVYLIHENLHLFSETIEKTLIIPNILINIIYHLQAIEKDLSIEDPFLLLI